MNDEECECDEYTCHSCLRESEADFRRRYTRDGKLIHALDPRPMSQEESAAWLRFKRGGPEP